MQCPYCGGDAAVLDSRTTSEGVRRRRNCSECKRRFTTYERVAAPAIKVVKRSGKSEAFDADKITQTLVRVSRDRPDVGIAQAMHLARSVEAQLVDGGAKSVGSDVLATMVLDALRNLDKLCYERFAANYTDESGVLRTSASPASEASNQLGLFPRVPKS